MNFGNVSQEQITANRLRMGLDPNSSGLAGINSWNAAPHEATAPAPPNRFGGTPTPIGNPAPEPAFNFGGFGGGGSFGGLGNIDFSKMGDALRNYRQPVPRPQPAVSPTPAPQAAPPVVAPRQSIQERAAMYEPAAPKPVKNFAPTETANSGWEPGGWG